ncbi:hypothetical protein GCK72_019692 [Caenorhabditis remanei]|uniref:MSP domain-containing protein n=1 Tax=Caenorhabditis remanei TaxID=31234 RepID=A0A6A5GEL7_CAERE|nr:hypothetical protein GCK72_019692 [Caenorhabditis remanei]KAF1753136.1 hypothetical protein GCK72_019692 [Caenorhabditis remanei]
MSLTFNTSSLKWAAPEGQAIVKITNPTTTRFAIKIKTSNVDTYKTTPNTDFIHPGYTLNLVVLRSKSPMKEDKLAINYIESESGETDAAEVFKKPGIRPNVYMITMRCEETPPAPGAP